MGTPLSTWRGFSPSWGLFSWCPDKESCSRTGAIQKHDLATGPPSGRRTGVLPVAKTPTSGTGGIQLRDALETWSRLPRCAGTTGHLLRDCGFVGLPTCQCSRSATTSSVSPTLVRAQDHLVHWVAIFLFALRPPKSSPATQRTGGHRRVVTRRRRATGLPEEEQATLREAARAGEQPRRRRGVQVVRWSNSRHNEDVDALCAQVLLSKFSSGNSLVVLRIKNTDMKVSGGFVANSVHSSEAFGLALLLSAANPSARVQRRLLRCSPVRSRSPAQGVQSKVRGLDLARAALFFFQDQHCLQGAGGRFVAPGTCVSLHRFPTRIVHDRIIVFIRI